MNLTVNGKDVFCATGGKKFNPDLPTTVFIHGAGFNRTIWKLQTRYFAWNGGSVLAVDLPGHGRSDGPPLSSIEDMALWLSDVIESANIKMATFIGHSMGSQVALEFAANNHEKVEALALLGSALSIPVNPILLESANNDTNLAFNLLNSWGYGRRAQIGCHQVPGLWMMKGGLRVLEQSAKKLLHTDLLATNDYSGEKAATAVKCPTLILMGERDIMTPEKSGKALAEMIPGSIQIVLPDVGHIMLEENPDGTLDALRDFILPLWS